MISRFFVSPYNLIFLYSCLKVTDPCDSPIFTLSTANGSIGRILKLFKPLQKNILFLILRAFTISILNTSNREFQRSECNNNSCYNCSVNRVKKKKNVFSRSICIFQWCNDHFKCNTVLRNVVRVEQWYISTCTIIE